MILMPGAIVAAVCVLLNPAVLEANAAGFSTSSSASYAVPPALFPLRFGAVKPRGWILEQMRRDLREGFAGHLGKLCREASPWADKVGGASAAGYKAVTQGGWALGAVLGSFFGAQIAAWLGRRRAYAILSAGATVLTSLMFLGTAPLQASFLPIVFAQGFVATLFFGWLPLYLPELFPTRVRAAGSGIAYNVGCFATALGVLMAGALYAAMGGSYPKVGATCGLIYLLGLILIWWAPDTSKKNLQE